MVDDLKKRGPADRSRVNVHESWELEWWSNHWGVTEQQIKNCVAKVGVMADNVKRCLGKA